MQSDDYLIDEELTELSGDIQNGNDTDSILFSEDDNGGDNNSDDCGNDRVYDFDE